MTPPASLAQALSNYHLGTYPGFTGVRRPVTMHSLADFSAALLWAGLLLVSFIGWGKLAARLLRVRPLPASVACSLGIGVVIFLGGWLNLAHGIYAGVLVATAMVGLLSYFWLRKERPEAYAWRSLWTRASAGTRVILLLALLIFLCRIAATVRLGTFRVDDDGAAYLAFPQKMLAAHHFAADPFSDRRVISSLGGAYLLQDYVLAATSLPHIGMADRSLGLALMFLALLDLGAAFGISPPQVAALELIAALVPQETFNLTFTILPIAMFLAMIWAILATIDAQPEDRWHYAALMGAVGGALLALKSTFLPYVGALALLPYVFLLWPRKRLQAWTLPLLAGVVCLSIMAAWMIAMQHESGTALYPLLGHGVDYASYHLFPNTPRFTGSQAMLKVFLQGIALLLLAAIQYLFGRRSDRSRLSFSVLVAAALAITAFNYESGGDFIWRYNSAQFLTAIFTFFAAQAAAYNLAPTARRLRVAYGAAVLSLAGCIFYYDLEGGHIQPFRQMATEMRQYRCNLRASLAGMDLVSPEIRAEYAAVEAALPSGTTALDVTTDSFLFAGVGHKKFFIDDWPGAASPRPGWPFDPNSAAIPAYLAGNSIRYVVYQYDYANWFDVVSCSAMENRSHGSQLDHLLQILSLVTHHQLNNLRATHQSIYDDGKVAVIDIQSPIAANNPLAPVWMLHTSESQMCSTIVPKYIARHPSPIAGPRDQQTTKERCR